MKKYLNNIIKTIWILSLLLTFNNCSDDDKNQEEEIYTTLIAEYQLPEIQTLYVGEEVSILGKGFASGDILKLKSTKNNVDIAITNVTEENASYKIPNDLVSGAYTVILERGNQLQNLGETTVNIVAYVPDKTDQNIKGKVYSGTTPLKGVRVSDGYTTTLTDENGHYWLKSDKKNGYVFITMPSGYYPVSGSNVIPGFWAHLNEPDYTVEQHDFILTPVNNDKHTIIAATDLHVANRGTTVNDMNQFKQGFMTEVPQFINSQSLPVYTLILGDMTWDYYWYSRSFALAQYRDMMSSYPAPMHHIMGNHDNDPYYPNDFDAEAKYKSIFGPTYYSMNIGKVHYIMLDNNVYVNTGASNGTMGDRDYKKYLTEAQLQWLKEDLAAITDKSTPIIVGFHCPSSNNYTSTFTNTIKFSPTTKVIEFYECFKGFSNINFLTGHSHYMANMDLTTSGINALEQNITAVCETWWWSGNLTPGMNVSTDGSPSGYKVFEIDGKNIEWYFKGINSDKTKQFRAYDMNKVKEFFAQEDVDKIMKTVTGYDASIFGSLPANSILLNVWDYDNKWEISATDKNSGNKLTCTRTLIQDPLHRLAYEYTRAKKEGKTDGFLSEKNSHMFLIETSSQTSSVEITVKNRFGKVFTETMTRPKEFTYSMQ